MWVTALLCLAVFNSGCVTSRSQYRRPVESFIEREGASTERIEFQEVAVTHRLYEFIPRHRSQVPWWAAGTWMTWSLLGNDDDGIFGERLQPPQPVNFRTLAKWSMPGVNFAHNLNGYVLGTMWRKQHSHFDLLFLDSRDGVHAFHRTQGKVWGPGRWSFNLTFNDWLPFVGLRLGILETGLGWKMNGSLTAAFRKAHVRPKETIPKPVKQPPVAGSSIVGSRNENNGLNLSRPSMRDRSNW